MVSLSLIMDTVTDDHHHLPGSRSHNNTNKKEHLAPPHSSSEEASSPSGTRPDPDYDKVSPPSHVSSTSSTELQHQHHRQQQHIDSAAPVTDQATTRHVAAALDHSTSPEANPSSRAERGVREGSGTAAPTSATTTTSSSSSSSLARSPTLSGPNPPGGSVRPSSRCGTQQQDKNASSTPATSTSTDSMDRSRYGPVSSSIPTSSAMASGGLQRPLPMHPIPGHPQYQPRMTPKTGRISKAKKGLPVHMCEICRPPKTFTRAEHLRRHQLSHEAPQYQCPGCDKAFHRPDLLARHQQKHDHDGESVPRTGPTRQSPRPPTTGGFSAHQPSVGATPSGPAVSSSASDPLSNPSADGPGATQQTPGSSSSHANHATYRPPHHPSTREYSNYTTSPSPSMANSAPLSSHSGPYLPTTSLGNYQPRTAPLPNPLVTQGLQLPSLQTHDVPDLQPPSSWPSSATDSSALTPRSDVSRNARPWPPSQRPSPYPSSVPRTLSPAPPIEPLPGPHHSTLFPGYYGPPQPSEHSFGPGIAGLSSSLTASSMDYSANHHLSHHSSSTATTARPLQQQTPPFGPNHGRLTPPVTGSGPARSANVLVPSAAPTTLGDHLSSLVSSKATLMGGNPHSDLSTPVPTTFGPLGNSYSGHYSTVGAAASSPGADSMSTSSGIVPELDLHIDPIPRAGPLVMTIPLPGPVRDAIPRYLELYWEHVDPVLPFIHRATFEQAPEDVLRCAMAAFATQHLDDREDRTRGSQLHEFAWQEVKRISQWSLQTMQAILLCEYFARFRGRKTVTHPSKPFETLCSRVLKHNQNSASLLDPHHILSADENQGLSPQDRWRNWIDAESHRRLLAACVFVDGHTAIYQQQRRAMEDAGLHTGRTGVPLFGRNANSRLWRAATAEEWAAELENDWTALQTETAPPLERLTPEDITRRAPADVLILLNLLAMGLPRYQSRVPSMAVSAGNSPAPEMMDYQHHAPPPPPPPLPNPLGLSFGGGRQQQQHHTLTPPSHHHRHQLDDTSSSPVAIPDAEDRIRTLYPDCPIANTYLALHHTPLRDLLAVSGDSWVFSQKVLPAASFQEHQRRLKVWATSFSSSSSSSSASSTAAGGGDAASTVSSATGGLAQLSSAKATVYAARAILGFLAREEKDPGRRGGSGSGSGSSSNNDSSARGLRHWSDCSSTAWSWDMSDYWAMYVCALVCWAFTHYPARSTENGGGVSVGGGGGGGGGGGSIGGSSTTTTTGSGGYHNHQGSTSSPYSSSSSSSVSSSRAPPPPPLAATTLITTAGPSSSSTLNKTHQHQQEPPEEEEDIKEDDAQDEQATIAWLRAVASPHTTHDELIRTLRTSTTHSHAHHREPAATGAASIGVGVVTLVRRRLEADCVGGRNRLYVDAVGVLRKLEEGRGWRWF